MPRIQVRSKSVAEPTKSEQTSSDACTRSGLFVLALSLSLAATVPLWDEQRNELVLGEYIASRLALSLSLEELDADSDWIERSKANPSLKSAPVAQLSKIEILSKELHTSAPTSSDPTRRPTVVSSDGLNPTAIMTIFSEGNLPPPSGLRVSYNIKALEEMEATLRELDDTQMLDRARSAHGLYNLLIYRWHRKAIALLSAQEQSDHPEAVATPHVTLAPQASAPPPAAFAIGLSSLATLSLPRVRELAEYEYPKLDVTTKLQNGGKQVELGVGALPRNLLSATLAVETMMAFALAYFIAFLREAATSTTFPTPGTLFGAFSRSIVTQGVFCVAVLAPALASVAVAFASKRMITVGFAVAIALQVAWLLWTPAAQHPLRWRR